MTASAYEAELMTWRQQKDESLIASTGWLALAGLYWLAEGKNTIGSDLNCDVILPDGAPMHLGAIDFQHGQARLKVTCPEPVQVDGAPALDLPLLADSVEGGPSHVTIGDVTFAIIQRSDQTAVRVWDARQPARLAFSGRLWFPVDARYRTTAVFHQHEPLRSAEVANTLGMMVAMDNPGWVDFDLADQSFRLEAFAGGDNTLWFIFRDGTSGVETYGAGRYLYALLRPDGAVDLDFNRAYNPPCAFTPYATCPRPPAGNTLAVRIEAGERYMQGP